MHLGGGVAAGYHCDAGPGDAAALPHSAGGRCAESTSARSTCMMNLYVTRCGTIGLTTNRRQACSRATKIRSSRHGE